MAKCFETDLAYAALRKIDREGRLT